MEGNQSSSKITFHMIASVVAFAVSICISLFITPVIVEQLGNAAYGFVSLANNFVNYAVLFTVALNSMESRFVSIELYKKNYEDANKYFTSIFAANVIIALVFAPIMIAFVMKMDSFLNIPKDILGDVKITFAIVFLQFIIEILTSRFEIATFVTNRLNLYYINQIIASIIRLFVILIGFKVFSVRIIFLVLGSLLGKLFVASRNVHYTKSFIPELKIRKQYFDFHCIKEVVSAGIWNLVSKLSGILLDGLDLLIANLFIGATEMGALSLSKTVPALFMTLRGTLDYPFVPPMTKCYARNDIPGVVKYARMGNKILGVFMIAPMAVFLIFGESFFKLWVPSQDARLLEVLSILSIISLLAGSCINSIFSIFTITNKVKLNSLVILMTGLATTATVFLLLQHTSLGVYAIAGVSSVFGLIRNFIFTPLYGAYCLKIKWSTFYHEIITGNICLVINALLSYGFYMMLPSGSWGSLLLGCICSGGVCVCCNLFIVLSKEERKTLLKMGIKKQL